MDDSSAVGGWGKRKDNGSMYATWKLEGYCRTKDRTHDEREANGTYSVKDTDLKKRIYADITLLYDGPSVPSSR